MIILWCICDCHPGGPGLTFKHRDHFDHNVITQYDNIIYCYYSTDTYSETPPYTTYTHIRHTTSTRDETTAADSTHTHTHVIAISREKAMANLHDTTATAASRLQFRHRRRRRR